MDIFEGHYLVGRSTDFLTLSSCASKTLLILSFALLCFVYPLLFVLCMIYLLQLGGVGWVCMCMCVCLFLSVGLSVSGMTLEHHSPFTRYVLSFKTRNTKWEIDSSWTENRVHWSTGDKRWNPHLELCQAAAGKLLYRTQAYVGKAPAAFSSFLSPSRALGLILVFLSSKMWPLGSAIYIWQCDVACGEKSRGTLENIRYFTFSVTFCRTTCQCIWGNQSQKPGTLC